MTLHYKGKYSGDPDTLPTQVYREGSVKFKEPESSKKLGLIANGLSVVLLIPLLIFYFWWGGFRAWSIPGMILSLLVLFPHEILHASCFREDVYLYTNWKQGMLFVIGPEVMTKGRFVFMSLLPNIVFGFLPFLAFVINPDLHILGTLGLMSIPMGMGDYINVFNALTQMPRGSLTYLYKFNSYWFMPGEAGSSEGGETA